jgi:hypothetical protein
MGKALEKPAAIKGTNLYDLWLLSGQLGFIVVSGLYGR